MDYSIVVDREPGQVNKRLLIQTVKRIRRVGSHGLFCLLLPRSTETNRIPTRLSSTPGSSTTRVFLCRWRHPVFAGHWVRLPVRRHTVGVRVCVSGVRVPCVCTRDPLLYPQRWDVVSGRCLSYTSVLRKYSRGPLHRTGPKGSFECLE